jgi:hypothetical protein
MTNPHMNIEDLPPEERRRLGVRMPRKVTFTMEDVRRCALRILGSLADQKLAQDQRRRVLDHALKINER